MHRFRGRNIDTLVLTGCASVVGREGGRVAWLEISRFCVLVFSLAG